MKFMKNRKITWRIIPQLLLLIALGILAYIGLMAVVQSSPADGLWEKLQADWPAYPGTRVVKKENLYSYQGHHEVAPLCKRYYLEHEKKIVLDITSLEKTGNEISFIHQFYMLHMDSLLKPFGLRSLMGATGWRPEDSQTTMLDARSTVLIRDEELLEGDKRLLILRFFVRANGFTKPDEGLRSYQERSH